MDEKPTDKTQKIQKTTFSWIRSNFYPILPFLFVFGQAAIVAFATWVLCHLDAVAEIYNYGILWLVTRYHYYGLFGVSLSIPALWVIERLQQNHWNQPIITVKGIVSTFCYYCLVVLCSCYLIMPWGLGLNSIYIVLPLLSLFLWFWFRNGWAYFKSLAVNVQKTVRSYLSSTINAWRYLELQTLLRAAQLGHSLERFPDSDREKYCLQKNSGDLNNWEKLFRYLSSLIFKSQRSSRTRSILGFVTRLTPRIQDPLALCNPVLTSELRYSIQQEKQQLQKEIYIVSRNSTLEDAAVNLLQERAHRLHLSVSACIYLHLPTQSAWICRKNRDPDSQSPIETNDCIAVALSHARDFSRMWMLPSLRGLAQRDPESNPLSLFWWLPDGLQGSLLVAQELVEQEIIGLSWLYGDSDPNLERTPKMVEILLQQLSTETTARQQIILQLACAYIIRWGLMRATGHCAVLRALEVHGELWEQLVESMKSIVRPIAFDAESSVEARNAARQTRIRFFDACLLSPEAQFRLIREEIDDCAPLWSSTDSGQLEDYYYFSQARLHEAWTFSRVDQRSELYRIAIDHLKLSKHPAVATAKQIFDRSAREAMGLIDTENVDIDPDFFEDVQRPQLTTPDLHGHWEEPLSPSKPPEVFFLPRLLAGWVFVCAFFGSLIFLLSPGPLLSVPDLRSGEQQLTSPITDIERGTEKESSLWLATRGEGIHIKAGGRDHHWNRWTEQNTYQGQQPGLPSNDARKLAITSGMVGYRCRKKDRNVVTLSCYPDLSPGTLPWIRPKRWSSFLGHSQFDQVSLQDLTTVYGSKDCPLLLFATTGKGLGRYHVATRRWLDGSAYVEPLELTINSENGYLGPGQGAIEDVSVYRAGTRWMVWLATKSGIAFGPVWDDDWTGFAPEDGILPSDWQHWTTTGVLGKEIKRIEANKSDPTTIDFLTKQGGLASSTVQEEKLLLSKIHIGQTQVANLNQKSLKRVVYSPVDRVVWTLHNNSAGRSSLSAYTERNHQWTLSQPDTVGRVFDMTVDRRGPQSVLLGAKRGLISAQIDKVLDSVALMEHGPKGFWVEDVETSTTDVGVLAKKPGASSSGFYVLRRNPDGSLPLSKENLWKTVIGPRRFNKTTLSLKDIAVVEPIPKSRNLYFGTKRNGVGYIDWSSQEIYSIRPEDTPSRVADLCVLPNRSNDHDLLQIKPNGRIEVMKRTSDRWTSPRVIWGESSSSLAPNDISILTALNKSIFLAGRVGPINQYNIMSHRWRAIKRPPSLTQLHTAAGEVWATSKRGRVLYQLEQPEGQTNWTMVNNNLQNIDFSDKSVGLLSRSRAVDIVTETSKWRLLTPNFRSHTNTPSLVARDVKNPKNILVAFGAKAGLFQLDMLRWHEIYNPGGQIILALYSNDSQFGFLDQKQDFYIQSRNGQKAQLRARGIRKVASTKNGFLALDIQGRVFDLSDVATTVIVGNRAAFDVIKYATDFEEWQSKLWVLARNQLFFYDQLSHNWSDVGKRLGAIKQIEVVHNKLFVVTQSGLLYSLRATNKVSWHGYNQNFLDLAIDSGAHFRSTKGATVAWISRDNSVLSVFVNDLGLFQIHSTDSIHWLLGKSQGPPQPAQVSCSAELDGDLYVGTKHHGLWIYMKRAKFPALWYRFDSRSRSIRKIITNWKDKNNLVVLGDQSILLYTRKPNGKWIFSSVLNELPTISLTVKKNDLIWVEAVTNSEQTRLRFLPGNKDTPFDKIPLSNYSQTSSTASVIIDSGSKTIHRSDVGGIVSRYDWARHSWTREGQFQASDLKLFRLLDKRWGWSRETKTLIQWTEGQWKKFRIGNETIQTVAYNAENLVVATQTGAVYSVDPKGVVKKFLPSSSQTEIRPNSLKDAVQLDNWLILTDGLRVVAYHSKKHSWKTVLSQPVDELYLHSENDQASSVIAISHEVGSAWKIHLGPSGLIAKKLELINEQVSELQVIASNTTTWLSYFIPILFVVLVVLAVMFRKKVSKKVVGSGLAIFAFLLFTYGSFYFLRNAEFIETSPPELDSIKTQRLLVFPNGAVTDLVGDTFSPILQAKFLNAAQDKQVSAVIEWQGRLLLSCLSDKKELAIYNPQRAAWTTLPMPGDALIHFWPSQNILYAEVRRMSKTDLFVLDHDTKTDKWNWTIRVSDVHGVTKDELDRLWYTDSKFRVNCLSADKTAVLVREETRLPKKIKRAVPHGDTLFALLTDGSVWEYSLETFLWRNSLAGTFSHLSLADGVPILEESIETGDGSVSKQWCFLKTDESKEWQPISEEEKASLSDSTEPLWEVEQGTNTQRIKWRSSESDKFRAAPQVIDDDGQLRLAFDQYTELFWDSGQLWCKTKAEGSDGPVWRKFATDASVRTLGQEIGIPTLSGGAKKSFESARHRSAILTDGEFFRTTFSDDGQFQTWWNQKFTLELKFDRHYVPVKFEKNRVGMWSFDLDVWKRAAQLKTRLFVATNNAVYVLPTANSMVTRKLRYAHQKTAGLAELFTHNESIVAVVNSEECYQFQEDTDNWVRLALSKDIVKDIRQQKLQEANDELQDWQLKPKTSAPIQLRVGPKKAAQFVPITLHSTGFGFDKVNAIGVKGQSALIYSVDGLIHYNLKNLTIAQSIDKSFALNIPASEPFTVYPSNTLRVWNGRAGYGFVNKTWIPLTKQTLLSMRREEKIPLKSANGSSWTIDEKIKLAFPKSIVLSGCFNKIAGQFSFDRVVAVNAAKSGLELLTDSGLLSWVNGELRHQHQAFSLSEKKYKSARFTTNPQSPRSVVAKLISGRELRFVKKNKWRFSRKSDSVEGFGWQGKTWRLTSSTSGNFLNLDCWQRNEKTDWQKRVWAKSNRCWQLENVKGLCHSPKGWIGASDAGIYEFSGQRLRDNKPATQVGFQNGSLYAIVLGRELQYDLNNSSVRQSTENFLANNDRLHVNGQSWFIERGLRGENRVFVKSKSGRRQLQFVNGRFDIDHTTDIGIVEDRMLLRTAVGYRYRDTSQNLWDNNKLKELNKQTGATSEKIFQGFLEGRVFTFVKIDDSFHYHDGSWQTVKHKDKLLLRLQGSSNLFQGPYWNVVKTSKEPEFSLKFGSKDFVKVHYSRRVGSFTFAALDDLFVDLANRKALFATPGGLLTFSLSGVVDQLDGEQHLRSNDDGTKKFRRSKSGLFFLPSGYLLETQVFVRRNKNWVDSDISVANKTLKDSEHWICKNSKGWSLERSGERRWSWSNQKIQLIPRGNRWVFAHDWALSAEYMDGVIYLATKSGVLRLKIKGDALVAKSPENHLKTKVFAGLRIVDIRRKSQKIVGRALLNNLALEFSWDRESQSWLREKTPSAYLLHYSDEFWQWKKSIWGTVSVELSESVGRLPRSYEWFRNGTFAFWDLTTIDRENDSICWIDHWILATPGGIIRINKTSNLVDQIFASDSLGKPLPKNICLENNIQTGDLLASYGGLGNRSYRYRSKENDWTLSSRVFRGRFQPVSSRWLEFKFNGGETSVRLKSELTNTPEREMLGDGGFLFDRVQEFCRWDSKLWLVTDIGVVQLQPKDGSIKHWTLESNAKKYQAESFHDGEQLHVSGRFRSSPIVWSFQSETWKRNSDPEMYSKLRHFVLPPLLTLDKSRPPRLSYGSESLGNRKSTLPIFENGVFEFDIVTDFEFTKDEVLVSTSAAVWEYSLSELRSGLKEGNKFASGAFIPKAVFFFDGSKRNLMEPVESSGIFLDGHFPNRQTAISQPGDEILIRKSQADWVRLDSLQSQRERSSLVDRFPNFYFYDQQGHNYKLSVRNSSITFSGGKGLSLKFPIAEHLSQQIPLGAFATESSFWIAFPNKLLWLRRNEVPSTNSH